MIKKILIIWLFLALQSFTNLLSLASSNPQDSTIPDSAAYLGQTPPSETPVVFAPGIVSLPDRSNLKIVFSPDGRESLIGVRVNDIPTILYAKHDSGHWTNPEIANFIVATHREKEPFFSPDGSRIFFVRYASIWVSNRINQSWATPEMLGSPINVNAEQYHPTVTLDGTLYFCSNRGGEYNIYRSKYENGRYSTVEKLDAVINTHVNGADGAYDPYIAPDESYIIFASVRSGGYGKEDHYISFNKSGHWTNPKNLGSKINTAGTEYGSYVSPDNKYYFFAKSKLANGDFWQKDNLSEIYWVRASFIDNLMHTNFIPYVKTRIPDQSGTVGQPFNYTLPADTFMDDDGNSTLTYSAALENGASLPAWLCFNPGTRALAGTPTEKGTIKLKIAAIDTAGATASTTFTLTAADAGGLMTKLAESIVTPHPKGAYFGQVLPGETPVLFAPEILNSVSIWVEATEFSPDGTQFFMGVGDASYSSAKLYYSKRVNDVWTPFAEAPFIADFTFSHEPHFSTDGATLTFTGKKATGTLDLWTVSYADQGWGTPVVLPSPINSDAKEYRGSTMSNGTVYFGSDRANPGINQVYKGYLDSGQKLVVEKLGPPINMNSYEGDPCVAPDGHFLIFYSARGGISADLYVSFSDGNGGWGKPILLGAEFNTANDEYGAHLSSDGKYLFFTRHHTSKGNGIYWVATSAIEKLKH